MNETAIGNRRLWKARYRKYKRMVALREANLEQMPVILITRHPVDPENTSHLNKSSLH